MNKFILGTVQFGVDYGITNKNGIVTMDEVYNILDYALKNGVTTIDTAAGYGDTENILGNYPQISNFDIITKSSPNTDKNIILDNARKSLTNLNINELSAILLHRPEVIMSGNPKETIARLNDLKTLGITNKVGISLYNPSELDFIIENDLDFDIVQIPLNIFDQRFLSNDLLKRAKNNGLEVHVRSIFLQGLILSSIEDLNPFFLPHINFFKDYHKALNEHELTPLQAVCAFINSNEYIDKALIGVCSLKQIEEIINENDKAINSVPDFSKFSTLEDELINPLTWLEKKIR